MWLHKAHMAGFLLGESTCPGTSEDGSSRSSHDKQEEMSPWFMSRKEIEDNSPSRRDGINLKRETYLRKSYCTFLRDLGKRLKVPQLTIATAILFCHRFFLCNSHSKNDRMIIATVCMFLAGKVEETPRPLRDVVLVSYEIAFKKDPEIAKRIKQKEVYEQRKELILIGERLVLATLGFDLIVHHPYIPLIRAIKKLWIAQNDVPRIAWNFVNDGLMTSLCLQFKPRQIAAGAIFLAAKFLKVKLPSENLWQELHVNPRQLEEISNQMLELYEQRRVPQSQGSKVEAAGSGGGSSHPCPAKMAAVIENKSNEKQKGEAENKDRYRDQLPHTKSDRDLPNVSRPGTEHAEEDQGKSVCRNETADAEEHGNDSVSYKSGGIVGLNLELRERSIGQTSKGFIEIKSRQNSRKRKKDEMSEDDNPVEMDLEESVRLVAGGDRNRKSWSKADDQCHVEDFDETGMEKLTIGSEIKKI